MARYLIGDLQGCDGALQRLLDHIDFSPSRDTLFVLGDLVNRGPGSAEVLRRLMGLGDAARCLLGNHDLHLLATAHGVRAPHRQDTLKAVLHAPDRAAMLDWVRHQRMAMHLQCGPREVLMVHAGVLPQWSVADTLALAAEVEAVLRGAGWMDFLRQVYGNAPDRWSDGLQGMARWRVIVNALTRLRFCDADGVMDFDAKEHAEHAPPGLMPWFDVPGRRTAQATLAFGHWSMLGWLDRGDVLSLDTGCVWGGQLSAYRLEATHADSALLQVGCAQAQRPG